ncbi:MAG: hypothetical protein SWH54_13575 [Thermodesulfobacteriota bacterium]|nr:hypothetical protein [Thermodesulfobacteriota bacterium]
MKDERGFYYYPNLQNKKVRTYVRKIKGEVFFRLLNSDDPGLWEEHGWLPYEAIKQAAALNKNKDFDSKQVYDINMAKVLLDEEE